MMKRFSAFLLAICLSVSFPGIASACDENQTGTYIAQILFGDSALSHESDEKVKMLLNALYMCSMQSDGAGQEKLDFLKGKRIGIIPSLPNLNIKGAYLSECSHNRWEYEYAADKTIQSNRRKLLQKTVNKVFDFGFIDNWFGSDSGKCNSFAAFLYYSHILSDYLADDPANTEVLFKKYIVPAYAGQAHIPLNRDKPSFTEEEKKCTESFAKFSLLDNQGRCGAAFANICSDIMPPANSRQQNGNIEPSGWNQGKYSGIVNSEPPYLYNRCHLIAHQLAGEDGETNLITGTRYLNIEGMKTFEDKVARYVSETSNHVLYRATPVFMGDNQVASGVQLEAYSVEDAGKGICFNVYCYNVQPGIHINYTNGNNWVSDTTFENEDMIPFATPNASESNPDLIFEMNRHLAVIFDDQKNSDNYMTMMNEITAVADQARAAGNSGETRAKYYMKLKEYEYEYFKVLKKNVPLLLKKEDFFKSAFKP